MESLAPGSRQRGNGLTTLQLAQRVAELENVIFGTREGAFKDGIKPQLETLTRRVNYWGAAITAAIFATGMLNGNAAQVVGAFLKGLGSP